MVDMFDRGWPGSLNDSTANTDTISVGPESDLPELINIMLEQKIGAVPVVDELSDKLVGIVSYVDVLMAARDSL